MNPSFCRDQKQLKELQVFIGVNQTKYGIIIVVNVIIINKIYQHVIDTFLIILLLCRCTLVSCIDDVDIIIVGSNYSNPIFFKNREALIL